MVNKKKLSAVLFLNAKITSTISITLVLVLLGVTLLVIFMGNAISKQVKENMSFNVMLSADISDTQISSIRKKLMHNLLYAHLVLLKQKQKSC